MRVQLIGGFLGAGKTTLARVLATELRRSGERVAIITNDQGRSLVDTELCRDSADQLYEVAGGCFCCRYPELETALLAARDAGATIAIAESVGSCTDIVATVIEPLADRCKLALEIEPLAVVVDPWRVTGATSASLGDDVDFLFRKQVEEADIVLVSRADLAPPDITPAVREWNSRAPVVRVSGRTGAGIAEWRSLSGVERSRPLSLDYDRYARAEALLGWCNASVEIRSKDGVDPSALLTRFLGAMAQTPVAHVKVTSIGPAKYAGAVTARHGEIHLHGEVPLRGHELKLLINARVALPPIELEMAVRDAMSAAAPEADVVWRELECFSPARPNPTHRYATRCEPGGDATCCAAFYQRDDVRRLLGDSYHPGGTDLTLRMMRAVNLQPGSTVLDVACGTGESLRAILRAWPVRAIGVDKAAPKSTEDGLEMRSGDAHMLPADDASIDTVLCECALSTFVDQAGALREMHRVLRPGGFLAVSDMVLEGEVPVSLRDWVHSGTCLERALSAAAYERAMRDAGFTVVDRWDASDGLTELLSRIKRNLVGWIAAAASGSVAAALPFDVRTARTTLRDAGRAVAEGSIRYGVFVGRRPL